MGAGGASRVWETSGTKSENLFMQQRFYKQNIWLQACSYVNTDVNKQKVNVKSTVAKMSQELDASRQYPTAAWLVFIKVPK